MAPGALPDDRPLSAIGRIKSEKALQAALNGNTATEDGAYTRGAKGQAEDTDRLAKLEWVQV